MTTPADGRSPTLDLDEVQRTVALGRCLIGSIDLDFTLTVIDTAQTRFGDHRESPWVYAQGRYVKVDDLAGRSQTEPPPHGAQPLDIPDRRPATDAYARALAATDGSAVGDDVAERLRASALTLSGASGVAGEVLARFPDAAPGALVQAVKVLYRTFALNARQAAYLLAGAAVLRLWPAGSAAAEAPERMRRELAAALGAGFERGSALSGVPVAFGVAPLLLDPAGAAAVVELADALMDDAAERLDHATQTAAGLWDYQEQVFFAMPAALAATIVSNALRAALELPGIEIGPQLVTRDRRRHEANVERWVRMHDALAFQAADIIGHGAAWASLRDRVRAEGPAAARDLVRRRLIPAALAEPLLSAVD